MTYLARNRCSPGSDLATARVQAPKREWIGQVRL